MDTQQELESLRKVAIAAVKILDHTYAGKGPFQLPTSEVENTKLRELANALKEAGYDWYALT